MTIDIFYMLTIEMQLLTQQHARNHFKFVNY